jgi:hypothetical protein
LIIAGQVAGAAHITGVEKSIIAVSSRQVRMHDCKDVDIYLMCSSRPIIEDCNGIRFAPIPECYVSPLSQPHLVKVMINRQDADDFGCFRKLNLKQILRLLLRIIGTRLTTLSG